MGRGRERIVYRSVFRLLALLPLGLLFLVGGSSGIADGDPSAGIFAALGVFVLAYACWPRLVVTRSGVVVRNLGTQSFDWADLQRPQVEPQLPHLGATWQHINKYARAARGGAGIGRQGYPGLVLHTRTLGRYPVMAVQSNVLTAGGFADRVASEIEGARLAARKGLDPIATVLSGRAEARSVA